MSSNDTNQKGSNFNEFFSKSLPNLNDLPVSTDGSGDYKKTQEAYANVCNASAENAKEELIKTKRKRLKHGLAEGAGISVAIIFLINLLITFLFRDCWKFVAGAFLGGLIVLGIIAFFLDFYVEKRIKLK